MSQSFFDLVLRSTATAQQVIKGYMWVIKYFGKIQMALNAFCEWLALRLTWPMVCSTLFRRSFNGADGWFYHGPHENSPPLSTKSGRVSFCACWVNDVGINGMCAGSILRLACNGGMTSSIGVCGERSH